MNTLTSFLDNFGIHNPPLRLSGSTFSIAPYPSEALNDPMRAALARVEDFSHPASEEAFSDAFHTISQNIDSFAWSGSILSATSHGRPIEKFSWCPRTGELLLVHPPNQHMTARGNQPFENVLRGIILHEARLITFRPFFPRWRWTKGPYTPFDKSAARTSHAAQLHAITYLFDETKGGWDFELNINNERLFDLTGRGGW